MAEIITLPPGVPPMMDHRVYVRSQWSGAWVELPGMQCLEATWSVAPTLPTATILWRYGRVKQPAQGNFFPETPTNLQDQYVRIEFATDITEADEDNDDQWTNTRQWYGIVRTTEQQLPGVNLEAGQQIYGAVGLESLLSEHLIRASHWDDGSRFHAVDFPHVMNPSGVGNMTPFSLEDGTRVYWYNLDTASTWSTSEIVRYLLRYHTPLSPDGERKITFRISPDNPVGVIPTWDEPEVDPRGQTTYSMLDRLLSRDRLIAWWLDVSETNEVELRCEPLAETSIAVPGVDGAVIPASSRQREIRFDSDPLTSAAVKVSTLEHADRVVCRGARRVSVGTFNIKLDNTLQKGWSDAREDTYNAGFSTSGGYGALSRRLKQERNQEVRSDNKLSEVYSRFLVPITWDRKTANGQGGTKQTFFPVETPGGISDDPYPVYPPAMECLPYLPLAVGVDYTPSTTTIIVPDTEVTEMEPFVAFRIPGTDRWIQAEKIGQNSKTERVSRNEPTFSVYSTIFRGLRGIMLRVTGGPQHAIAKEWFVKLPDDIDPGDYDASEAVFTLAIPDDRFAEGQWPPSDTELDDADVLRVKYIDAGEQYRHDWLTPSTVVGITSTGTLATAEGGEINDDADALGSLARIAYQWYGLPRNVLSIDTPRAIPPVSLTIGDHVIAIGTPETPMRLSIRSTVTQLSVRVPVGGGTEADAPVQMWRWTTGSGELDPLQIAPRTMTSTARREIAAERERMRMRGVMRGDSR